jgi:type VI secretion system protein ImpA
MSTATGYAHDLLDPILPDLPGGADMRWTPEWDRIREARRADDDLETGKWTKRERKVADWKLVRDLCTSLLRERTKDLQLALWLTEADIKLRGFSGLHDGLRITRELMVRYWDRGLFPTMEDGPEDRAGPFDWLNNKLVDSIKTIPVTIREDQGPDYSFNDLIDARRIGSEANCKNAHGEMDTAKKKALDQAVAAGHVSMDLFAGAVKATKRHSYEEFSADFQQTYDEFKALERVIDEKFGDAAPNLAMCRSTLSEIRQAITDILDEKRREEPPPAKISQNAPGESGEVQAVPIGPPRRFGSQPSQSTADGSSGSWQQAESLVRAGLVDQGLQEMIRLAAAETTGRDRFKRKLLLADVCLTSSRNKLARSILEELGEQIDKFQLESWESSELISSVWTRLYRLYKGSDSPDPDRASKLYARLCRLDPWQALGCE